MLPSARPTSSSGDFCVNSPFSSTPGISFSSSSISRGSNAALKRHVQEQVAQVGDHGARFAHRHPQDASPPILRILLSHRCHGVRNDLHGNGETFARGARSASYDPR